MMTTRENTPAQRCPACYIYRERLTKQERNVLAAVLAGHVTYEALASTLNLAENTVRRHLHSIYLKADAVNLADLVLMALGRKPSAVDLEVVDDGS